MSKHRKRWTIEEKEEILLYYKEHGIGKASTVFNVSAPSIYKWDKEFNGEQTTPKSTKSDKQLISQLERKILALQKIVADNALELRIKEELLKKKKSPKR